MSHPSTVAYTGAPALLFGGIGVAAAGIGGLFLKAATWLSKRRKR